jgi:hypothetical protein
VPNASRCGGQGRAVGVSARTLAGKGPGMNPARTVLPEQGIGAGRRTPVFFRRPISLQSARAERCGAGILPRVYRFGQRCEACFRGQWPAIQARSASEWVWGDRYGLTRLRFVLVFAVSKCFTALRFGAGVRPLRYSEDAFPHSLKKGIPPCRQDQRQRLASGGEGGELACRGGLGSGFVGACLNL